MLHRTLPTDASPPVCLLFASWLMCCRCCCAAASTCSSTCRLHLATCRCLLSTSPPGGLLFPSWLSCCISSGRLHLTSPFVAPLLHVSILNPPPYICIGWLLRCISLRCLSLPSSCQHCRLLMRRRLTLRQQLHLPFASRLPRLVAALPFLAPPPHICQLTLPSNSASCHVLFSSAPASCCVVSLQPATLQPPPSMASPAHGWLLRLPPAPSSLIAVAWPLLLSGWLLHCLPLIWLVVASPLLTLPHLPSAGTSASHRVVTSRHAPLCAIASRASSPYGCCNASPHTATSNPLASPPLIAPLPLVTQLPPMPLVQLVVASPLLTLLPPICRQLCLSLRCCLLSCPSPCH
jgi:hypothetical protein